MQYFYKETNEFEKSKKYLLENSIEFDVYNLKTLKVINVYSDSLKEKIEREEKSFLKSQKISLEYGFLATKQYKEKSIVDISGVKVGACNITTISGPCSIENEESLYEIARSLKKIGVQILRGGAFKPRTSPYDFQGLGKVGLEILNNVGREVGMPIITEIMDIKDLDLIYDKVDALQVGARNMHNISLLKELGKINKPILLKRGFNATIKEFMLAAEYIMLEGNENLILCERGIRTFENATRNTLDLSAVSLLKQISHLPVVSDPSHGTGKRTLIKPMSFASIAAGADGLVIETHNDPDNAYSDGAQSITPFELEEILDKSNKIKEII